MNRKWWLLPLAIAVAVPLVWFASGPERRAAVTAALGLKPAPVAAQRQKPICSSVIVPAGDCIPQHLANLPPDPGEAGKLTIDGIDADKDGVRDDVQRWIWETWPDSERAREALFVMAKATQMRVHHGDSLGKEETRKLVPEIMLAVACYMGLATPEMLTKSASESVRNKVTNTPERWQRSREFDYLLAHNVYALSDATTVEACGFDPATLPN